MYGAEGVLARSTATSNSSIVTRFSRMKSWRCWTRPAMTERIRGVAFGPVAEMTS
jgi:hypothetical protein